MGTCAAKHPLQPGLEELCSGYAIVLHHAVEVALRLLPARTQLSAKEHVGNPRLSEPRAESVSVKLGVETAIRLRADVRNSAYPVLREEREKRRQGMSGVPYGVDRFHYAVSR